MHYDSYKLGYDAGFTMSKLHHLCMAADIDVIEAALLDAHDMEVTLKDYAQSVSRYIMELMDLEVIT